MGKTIYRANTSATPMGTIRTVWQRACLWAPWAFFVSVVVSIVACGSNASLVESSIQAKHAFGVCTRDPDIETDATEWTYPKPDAPAISNQHPQEYNRAVLESGVSYYYDPYASPRSIKVLPFRFSALSCDRMHKVALNIEQLRPCSDDICALMWPAEFSLPDDGGTCRLESRPLSFAPVRGNLLGQTEGPSIRSTYFCDTMPVVPKNGQQLILDKRGEVAWLEGYTYGYRVSLLLTQAEADIQAFINHSDPWIVALFKKDPGSVDAIMQRAAAMLDAIPEPPPQETSYLDHMAQDGYAMGTRHGAIEVEQTLFLIQAGATIAEVALMEIALGPLGGANALRAAITRLGNIPVFIPGAAGGVGGVVRLGSLLKKAFSSERLAAALIKAGKIRGAGQEAHHIVAGGHRWAEESRAVLAKFGIKLDEAVNGVFLPATMKSPNPLGSIVHRTLSNNKAYYDAVNKALRGLTTRAEVEAKLREIAQQLIKGTFL